METHQVSDLGWLNDALVFLFATGIVIPLLKLARVPTVLGFLLAGLALGPFGMGLLAESFPVLSYVSISDAKAVQPFAELGVLFLLFLLGLELSFKRLWSLRQAVLGSGGIQTVGSASVIGLAVFATGVSTPAAISLGLAFALSSTAIVMQVLTEERRATQPIGRLTLAVLLFQDIMVAPILILVGFLGATPEGAEPGAFWEAPAKAFVAVASIFVIGRFVLKHAFRAAARAGGRDLLMGLTLLTVIGAALTTSSAGLSLPLGAFLAGLLLGETEFKHQTEVDLEPFKGLLLGLFFTTVGMTIDLASAWAHLQVVLMALAVLLVVKAVIAFVACRLIVADSRISLEAAFLLASAGEFAFVVIQTARATGALTSEVASIAAVVASLSMLATPVLARAGRQFANLLAEAPAPALARSALGGIEDHVVIAGYGRVGHIIAEVLESEGADIIAIEKRPEIVAAERDKGVHIFLGDASRPEILKAAGALKARLFVVTIDNALEAERMVRAIAQLRPDAPVFARAVDVEHAETLTKSGASFVVPDAIEAALQLGGRALVEFGYSSSAADDRIASIRDVKYRLIDTAEDDRNRDASQG
jgi:CPA2 family monovalent cation:H+ antiporter-2